MYNTSKLFLFDFDGVIVDSLDFYENRVKRCLDKIGKQIIRTRSDFLALFEDNFYEAIVKKGVDLEQFANASEDIPTQGDGDQMAPFAFMLPVLNELKKENILVIISSNVSSVIRAVLSQHNFNGCFRDVMGVDTGYSKEVKIRRAMERFQVEQSRTYYIGDTAGDIKEARRAGVKTVAVTWGWHAREMLDTVKPDYIIDNARSLLNISVSE
jgi:phosphoglycolate phosphatase